MKYSEPPEDSGLDRRCGVLGGFGTVSGLAKLSNILYKEKQYYCLNLKTLCKPDLIHTSITISIYSVVLNKRAARLLIFEKFSYLHALIWYLHVY